MWHIREARRAASSALPMKAPLPHFTSRTMDEAPAASFLDITLAAISGKESTVAVSCRSA